MSMTQVVFLRKVEIPSKAEVENHIQGLGYDFKIIGDFESLLEQDGLSCVINGQETFFEIYFDQPSELTDDYQWILPDLTNQDIAVSFVWGADFAAGACIGLISIALIDRCQALVYYLDDHMTYTREMLISDTPQFLEEIEKQKKIKETQLRKKAFVSEEKVPKQGLANRLIGLFKRS